MIYQMIDKHGQTHVGYFVVHPVTRKMSIIKREQWRNRKIAELRFDKRCQFTANVGQRYIVRFVVNADAGQVESYATEQEARAAMHASMAVEAPGITRAIEVHLYHPVARTLPTVDVQLASAESWTPPDDMRSPRAPT